MSVKIGKPFMPNLQPLISSGILKNLENTKLKENTKKILRLVDEQDCVNRYVWYNLPCDLTSQELERLLYYRGQLCFFYEKETAKFYFMPYAGSQIDFYGRFTDVKPVPISSGTDKEHLKARSKLLDDMNLEVVYAIQLDKVDNVTNKCVLLHDYTKQLPQTIIPRQEIHDPILDVMAECVPMMRTSLIASSGVKAVRVNDADQADSVAAANKSTYNAALTGEYLVPIVGTIEMQELTDHPTAKAEEYMLALQSLDNFRLSSIGIDNGGLFNKKSHILQSEADINGGPVGLVLQDGLSIRQNFCNICNSLFGTSMWCEPAENIIGSDIDGDGLAYDRNNNAENSGVENQGGTTNDDTSI